MVPLSYASLTPVRRVIVKKSSPKHLLVGRQVFRGALRLHNYPATTSSKALFSLHSRAVRNSLPKNSHRKRFLVQACLVTRELQVSHSNVFFDLVVHMRYKIEASDKKKKTNCADAKSLSLSEGQSLFICFDFLTENPV